MSKSKNKQPSVAKPKGRPQSALKAQLHRKMKRIDKSSGTTAVLNWCEQKVQKGHVTLGNSKPVNVPFSKSEALQAIGCSAAVADILIGNHKKLLEKQALEQEALA